MEVVMESTNVPVHNPTPEALKYLESMTPDQKKLHELAIKMLASSYFVERTRGFEDWKKKAGARGVL